MQRTPYHAVAKLTSQELTQHGREVRLRQLDEVAELLGGPGKSSDALLATLQVASWIELTLVRQLGRPELAFDATLYNRGVEWLQDTFNRLANEAAFHQAALIFSSFHLAGASQHFIRSIFEVGQNLVSDGLFRSSTSASMGSAASAVVSAFARLNDGPPLIPAEVADLMIDLAKAGDVTSVYIPYDRHLSLSIRALRVPGPVANYDRQVGTEIASSASPLPWIIAFIEGASVDIRQSDPIRSPAFTDSEGLKQFDRAIAFLPFGVRYSLDVARQDPARFPEATSSGAVLAIRQLLAQTRGRIVIAVQNNVLFASGAEQSLRRYLVEQGYLRAVVAMPSGLLQGTPISFSLLVLERGAETVRFVDATGNRFVERDGWGRATLSDRDGLTAMVQDALDGAECSTVSLHKLAQDLQLLPGRYCLSAEQRRVNEALKSNQVIPLSEAFSIYRPRPRQTSASSAGHPASEASPSDFPEFGYLTKQGRSINLEEANVDPRAILREGDLLLSVKGTIGKVALVGAAISALPRLASQACVVIRRSRPELFPTLSTLALYVYLRSEIGQSLIRRIITGSTVPNVLSKELAELQVIVPTTMEVEQLHAAFDEQVRLQQQIESARTRQEELSRVIWSVSTGTTKSGAARDSPGHGSPEAHSN